MIYGLYESASGLMTHEYRQSVISNNLANADTVGFKRDVAVFMERIPASRAGMRQGESDPLRDAYSGGVWLGRTETDFRDGSLQPTGDPLDVALQGPGFFTVEKDGKTLLTRDGRLLMDATGQLRSAADGAAILGEGGRPLTLNPHGGEVFIDEAGHITQDRVTVGQLAVVDVENYAVLKKVGAGRYSAEGAKSVPSAALLRSGFTESSGIEPVNELVGMIESSRAYQLNAQMITLQDQTIGRLLGAVAA